MRAAFLMLVLGLVAGCDAAPLASRTATSTELHGQTLRGPVQPVCQIGEPCEDVPFSADFTVLEGSRSVATFRSGDDGRFAVALQPGTYTIVPGADAPILNPTAQARSVTVAPSGVTEVVLAFETGIR